MARTSLDEKGITRMRPGDERGDAACPGLRVRRNRSATTFHYRYRDKAGALREIKLGELGPLTLASARKALAKLRQKREEGIDPQLEKRKGREQATRERVAQRQAAYSVKDLVEEYVSEVTEKHKRGRESARLLRRELLPKLGHRPALDITRAELQDAVIRPVMKRAPRVATMLLSQIRGAFQHAIDEGRLPDDFTLPTIGIKGAKTASRKRAFTDAELQTFMRWLPKAPYSRTVRDALALMLFTGSRSGEIVAARWRDVDLERGVWTLHETKNEEPHDVMLPRQAIALLQSRQGVDGAFVFPSPRAGQHVAQKAVGVVQYHARKEGADPIELPWVVHDLRRSVATGLARLKCPRVVQDRILNHVDRSVSAIYDRHNYDAEAREWLQRWADHMDALTAAKVIPIDGARAA